MDLADAHDQLAEAVKKQRLKFVFAESCTAGLCAATMGQVDGISNHLCGSAVTYRPAAKESWLQVPAELIAAHSCESAAVAEAMAANVLQTTREADWAASVVGHLADGRPSFVFVGIAHRHSAESDAEVWPAQKFAVAGTTRTDRQREATETVLFQLARTINARAD